MAEQREFLREVIARIVVAKLSCKSLHTDQPGCAASIREVVSANFFKRLPARDST